MRLPIGAVYFGVLGLAMLAAGPAVAQHLPACDTQVMTRHGNEITVGLQQLSNLANKKLQAAGSNFKDLHLTADGGNALKISGKNNGTPVSISGPLQPMKSGAVKLHANKIVQNGTPEKGMMGMFGKNLADYAHFNKTDMLSAQGNNLFIHPDPLLNVSGPVTRVRLHRSAITLDFASQPCR